MINDDVSVQLAAAAREFIETEARAVAAAVEADAVLPEAVALVLASSGRVVLTGAGTSGFTARRSAHLLSVSGTPAFAMNPSDALHGSMGAVTPDDVLIALSKGGESAEVNAFASRVHAAGTTVIAVTANHASSLAQLSDRVVVVPAVPGADPGGLLGMGHTLATSAWLDALAVVLMRIGDRSWTSVHEVHPGGAVGALADLPDDLPPLPSPTPSRPAR
ncbi:SIS domain-containing protein [Curtobacterium flaccumfaciens]|uniref:SIS domain-containing protein n=1 Tax=Curtobacterium flaccumfaciens TaxID=2035 RepID=UPI001E3325A9|nr:SIS domain-containing protein [Curtobacterium allii]MCE0459708.1 SIS domain-containing protein [Curtobacterium allii]